jgi:hypothetical protein
MVHRAEDFLEEEAWTGGYYELGLVLGRVDDADADERLGAALHASWSHPSVVGPFKTRWLAPAEQTVVDLTLAQLDLTATLYGWLTLPFGRVVLATHVVREEGEGPNFDWLDVCIPVGALALCHPAVGGYPFEPEPVGSEWRTLVDPVLISIAERVAGASVFRRGLIGFEVSGDPSAVRPNIPKDRHVGYLTPDETGVRYFPPNC